MINTKEIRVGNWVSVEENQDPETLRQAGFKLIDEDEYYHTFARGYFPIALTPDILGKSGFKHSFGDWYINFQTDEQVSDKPFLQFRHRTGMWYLFGSVLPHQPAFLHQLQNLYYALTKQELKISLGQVREPAVLPD